MFSRLLFGEFQIDKIRKYADSHALGTVLLVSGIVGFSLGLSNATWQVTVESGQVLSGIVEYPADSPLYSYHIRLFTIVNQISAILVFLFGSELVLSVLISGVLGMVSFMAISTVIFSISRKPAISILGVLLIYFSNYVGDGSIYPIWLLGEPHTYGILGLSFAILSFGLLGSGAYRSGLFCLALAPCVHPSLGTWAFFCVCVSGLFHRDRAKEILSRYYAFALAGGLITLGSLAYQVYLIRSLPGISAGEGKVYFDAFVKYWGRHQEKLYWGYSHNVGFRRWGIVFCICSVFACGLVRKVIDKDFPATFLLTALMISGVGSLLSGFVTQLPPERVPTIVLMFMPGRFLNLNNVALPAILLGILTFGRNRPYAMNHNVFVLFLVGGLLARHCEAQMVAFAIVLWWLGCLLCRVRRVRSEGWLAGLRENKVSYEFQLGIFLVIVFLLNLPREKFIDDFLVSPDAMKGRTNSHFFGKVAEGDGFLLTTHYGALISLKTRRPTLLDMSSPNTLTYSPQSGRAFNTILKRFYNVDLLSPPPEAYRHREILPELYQEAWERRTRGEWTTLGREYHVTNVITPSDWSLDLPIAAKGEGMILFTIPEQ